MDHWKRCDKPNAINRNPSFGDGWYWSNIFCVARKVWEVQNMSARISGPAPPIRHGFSVIFRSWTSADVQKSFWSWDSAMSMLAMSDMCKHVDVIQPTSNPPSLEKLSDLHGSHHIPSQPLYVWHPGFSYWNWISPYRGGGSRIGWHSTSTLFGLDKLHSSYIPILYT